MSGPSADGEAATKAWTDLGNVTPRSFRGEALAAGSNDEAAKAWKRAPRSNGKQQHAAAQPPTPPPDEPQVEEAQLPPEWTPRMTELWDKLTDTQRLLFRGPCWQTQTPTDPVRELVTFMRQCRRHYHMTLEDLLPVQFQDGFGNNEFHRQWARRFWEDGDKQEREADEAEAAIRSLLTCTNAPWSRDALPPRPWVAPPYLMRGEITVAHGGGATGKSLAAANWSIACVLKHDFGRLSPRSTMRVLLTNFEDNAIEQMRRLSAALGFFNATESNLQNLHRVSLGPSCEATMFRLDEQGQLETTPIWDALQAWCRQIRPDVVVLDPLIAINAAPESDNQIMRRVMTMLKVEIAMRFNCALVIVHHDAKSAGEDTANDQTNSRGAGDIVNAARFEAAIKGMTVTQAEGFGIEREQRKHYFRVGSEDSKRNYTAPEAAEWFERLAIVISGEAVVYCVPWQPPNGKLTEEQTAKLIAEIGNGTSRGPYSPQLGKGDRSLSPLLEDLGIVGVKQQRRALDALIDRHEVETRPFRRPGHGSHERRGLRTAAGAPYNCEWCEEGDTDAAN